MRQFARRFQLWPSVALASAVAIGPATAGEANADAARLANLVRQDCGSCHGLTLKGGLGKPLTPDHLSAWSRDQLISIVLDGVPGTPMPPWRPLLSEADVRWIVERLQQGDLP
ncbi:cytochrome C556 [Bradyrhizobium nanningense]|uniref:Cytochrome C556 n=1 Tax=Bradyrhizobium nanningense TaxID=1325118 RepID=A0A4V1L0X9_9BRAD|nr:cytochrome C556 [Bradyrhizobium nanningense]RXH28417.1 cytochrome C556 [Bradyrhizobium nanningense]TQF31176.1 cytochrome C556 [Bradyrhizobium sp. UNPA324]